MPRDDVVFCDSDDNELEGWTSFTLRDDYTDPLGGLDLHVTPPRGKIAEYQRRLVKGREWTITINDVPQATMLIETVRTKIGPAGVSFALHGKSLLSPMFQGSAPLNFTFRSQADVPVSNVILKLASDYGFDTLVGDERANRDTVTGRSIGKQGPKLPIDELKHRDLQAHDGETTYALIARLITRLGVVSAARGTASCS